MAKTEANIIKLTKDEIGNMMPVSRMLVQMGDISTIPRM